MIRLAIIFLVIGLICGAFGFYGAEGAFVGIAKILFFIAVALFVIFLILGITAARKIT